MVHIGRRERPGFIPAVQGDPTGLLALTQHSCHQPPLGRMTPHGSVFRRIVLSALPSGNGFVR
jgi:hypothetical protein